MRRVALFIMVAVLAPAALARADQPASGVGPASAAALRTVHRHHATRGALNPGRAATVLARTFRAAGDDPRQVACTMTAADTATCTITVDRAGARWTGTGKVWQGHRAYRAAYDISTGGGW